ncbi:cysteine peptidase family C39 domain-containing protein, partial [Porphyromonas levii]|uniref:cysteine peptidase family C39 domain-containing protein n=1 Tax=Porphyromonas levii TaxID=28114 RepID=UPI0020127FD0
MQEIEYIKQKDAMDCGPVCLAMVVKHYGCHPDLEQIRKDCALGKEGVSLLGISKAAEKRGLHSLGGRITFETLANEAPLPCIAHWNQNHFIVVYKVKRLRKGNYRVYVADPGKGLFTYTKQEFCEHWVSTKTNGEEKGIVLLLEPTDEFYSQEVTDG